MSKSGVRQALAVMDDEEVRGHLANGDFSDVAELDLDDYERQLVHDAAGEYPDVAGDVEAFALYMKFGDLKGDVTTEGFNKWIELDQAPATQKIFNYCATGKHFPEAQL